MNITECFQMRKRRSIDKTPGRSYDTSGFPPRSPADRLRRTSRGLHLSSCNNSFSDQSLEIVWDNNSPSPARTLSLGKRKKHYGSDSSSSGGEISDLVQKLADKSGHTPEANPPLLAVWMSRDSNTTVPKCSSDAAVKGNNAAGKQKIKEFQTPSRRPRRVLRKCNKSKMKLLKQDIELLIHPVENSEEESSVSNKNTILDQSSHKQQVLDQETDDLQHTGIKEKGSSDNNCLSSVGGNFFDVWDTDEDDLILSQVEIPSFQKTIPETQFMTNTQFLDSGNEAENTLCNDNRSTTHVNSNESIVTESWDFVDTFGESDDENILQTALEDFERSQQVSIPTVRRLSNLHVKPSLVPKDSCKIGDFNEPRPTDPVSEGSKNNSCVFQTNLNTDQKCSQKRAFTFIPRSSIQSTVSARAESVTGQQIKHHGLNNNTSVISSSNNFITEKAEQNFHKVRERNLVEGMASKQGDSAGQMNLRNGTVTAKPTRYSKEEIERKKLEAQNRRKQKMALSQQKYRK